MFRGSNYRIAERFISAVPGNICKLGQFLLIGEQSTEFLFNTYRAMKESSSLEACIRSSAQEIPSCLTKHEGHCDLRSTLKRVCNLVRSIVPFVRFSTCNTFYKILFSAFLLKFFDTCQILSLVTMGGGDTDASQCKM